MSVEAACYAQGLGWGNLVHESNGNDHGDDNDENSSGAHLQVGPALFEHAFDEYALAYLTRTQP